MSRRRPEAGELTVGGRGDGADDRHAGVTEPAGHARRSGDFGLEGRTLYLPQMPYGGCYLLAAAIRSIGFDAWVDDATRTSARSSSAARSPRATSATRRRSPLGDFLRIIEDEGRDNVAFLMPTANGPCRFGQYLHLIRRKSRRARLRRTCR